MVTNPSLYIKAELIDLLLANFQLDLLITELPFLKCNRLADLVAVYNNFTIGFEIKSEKDSLLHLNKQILDYMKVFNMVYIVIAEKFYKKEEIKKLHPSVGIIVISSAKGLSFKRKASCKKQLTKEALLSLLWKKDLISLTNNTKADNLESLKKAAIKKSQQEIQKQVITALRNRYFDSYQMFMQDRESYTTVEDLRTITGLKKNPFL